MLQGGEFGGAAKPLGAEGQAGGDEEGEMHEEPGGKQAEGDAMAVDEPPVFDAEKENAAETVEELLD